MSKAKAIRDALDETAQNAWQCATCSAPSHENDKFCRSCRMYWDDVKAGLFDRDEFLGGSDPEDWGAATDDDALPPCR